MRFKFWWFTLTILLFCGCAGLQRRNQVSSLQHGMSDFDQMMPRSVPLKKSKQAEAAKANQAPPVYALDQQTFRFQLSQELVWNAALSVLLKNYNLNIIDTDSGVITTEWDSFFLDDSVYRNKVSLRIQRISRRVTDVTVLNNVERLQDASQARATIGAVWLPAQDVADELKRLIQNMSLALNQPAPDFYGAKTVELDQGKTKLH